MKVSILILVVDRIDFLKRCVDSIIQNTHTTEYEIVFILQNSPNYIEDYINSVQCNKKIFKFDTNVGVTPGRNKAIELSTGDFLLFFDDDAYVAETITIDNKTHIPNDVELDWLARMTKYFINDTNVGIVGQSGSYINTEQKGIFWECKGIGAECDVAQGYCFMFSKEVVNKIGGLDPYFAKVWHEESEYALRAKFNNFKVINSGYIGVYHIGSASGDDGSYGNKYEYMWNKWKQHFNKILVKRDNWKI